MKRWLALLMVLVLALSAAACSSSGSDGSKAASANAKKVLLVRAKEGGGEDLIISHLKKTGYTVFDVVDASFKLEQANGYGVIYISAAANSAKFDNNQLKQSTIPVVLSKTQLAGNIGMAGVTSFGEEDGVVTNDIKDAKHPLAAGLTGTVAIFKDKGKISYGRQSGQGCGGHCRI
ncbi:hypothetical protein LJK87_20595 [Paenibacillus sp. P25]|nr:hypothetical protein LJK87_20595 [Paenibacillus sp. P25]